MDSVNIEHERSIYLILWERYQQLGNGAKADIRRVAEPKELLSTGAFFRLCKQDKDLTKFASVVFMLPWLSHEDGKSLGSLLYKASKRPASEGRMIQMLRADYPKDIVALRRMVWQVAGRHSEKAVDWNITGGNLFYWGEKAKQRILQDYYISELTKNDTEEE